MNENINNTYQAIIVDTNAFDAKCNDFCGLFGSSLPSFFETINELNVQLLSHQILKKEIIHHIESGELKSRPENTVTAIKRNQFVFDLIGIPVSEIIEKINKLDLCAMTISAYNTFFENAIMLPFSNPEKVFEKYFDKLPPFASKEKKSEFPDAFVIDSLEQFIKENPKTNILVVTNDSDWTTALQNNSNIQLVDSIDSALQVLNSYQEKIEKCVDAVYSEIETYICDKANSNTWFEIYDYECEEEIEIEDIRCNSIRKVVPLRFTDNELVLQICVDIEVDGATTILDYNNSVWDSEEKCYILTSFSVMDFSDASGEIIVETHLVVREDDKIVLDSIKVIAPHGVFLSVDEEKAHFTDLSFDVTDAQGEMMDALEEYHKH